MSWLAFHKLPKVRTCLTVQVEQKTPNLGQILRTVRLGQGRPNQPLQQASSGVLQLCCLDMSVSGMDPSFIKYYREHGMTPYLMESLMIKRGWTLEMINKVIKNCNLVWKTSVGPVQNIRYDDEMDTDEELGPMPRTEDNTGAAAATVTSKTMYIEGGP